MSGEADVDAQAGRSLAQLAVGAAALDDVKFQSVFGFGLQQGEGLQEVGFAGSVVADEDVEGAEAGLLVGEALEAGDGDLLDGGHG